MVRLLVLHIDDLLERVPGDLCEFCLSALAQQQDRGLGRRGRVRLAQDVLHDLARANDEVVALLDDFLKGQLRVPDRGKGFGPTERRGGQAAKGQQQVLIKTD